MKVILLEKINKLGGLGDEISVKPGFARNYLFPKYKAVLANKKNRIFFQEKMKEIEIDNEINIQKSKQKEQILKNIELKFFVKTSEKGNFFGSINVKNIINLLKENGVEVEKNDIKIKEIINQIGTYNITIDLKNNIKIDKKLSVMKEE